MAGNDDFMASIDAFVEKAKSNQEQVVRTGCIGILARLVEMSPVGNPELWEVNQTAVQYNNAVIEYNDQLRNNPDNLTRNGRLKRGRKIQDSMAIRSHAGYTGGRFRGNWQVSFDERTTEETGRIDKSGGETLRAGNLVLSQFRVGMKEVFFCNNVPYAYPLEMGHSSQAPGGMVRITAAEAARFFDEAAKEIS
ncbi:TPA: hypothetical protein NKO55_000303 [Enterobacter asburiae]|nr:hypothetical protein [Enterobacter asburiae]